MNQIPNIEETELIKFITDIVWEATDGGVKITPSQFSHFEEPIGALTDFQKYLHHQLQKAREEERERIEAVFKEYVPPHAMDLEDSVWLKRLLNKAFNHDKNI